MAVVYSTAALVKKRCDNLDAGMADADIEECIYNAEGIIDALIKDTFTVVFDADKHKIIRQAATDIAAYLAVIHNPGDSFLTLADAEFTENLLWNSAQRSLSILDDSTVIVYLKAL